MLFLLQTADPAQAMGMGGGLGMFLPLVAIVVIMYFFMLRPQNKRQKELQKKIDSLEKGDKVVTIGGIHGTVASTREGTIVIKVDDNTKIEFDRKAIADVIMEKKQPKNKADSTPAPESEEKKDE